MNKLLHACIVIAACTLHTGLFGQIYRLDTRKFPIVTAWHIAQDDRQNAPPLTVLDNDQHSTLLSFTCSKHPSTLPADIIICVDISSSNAVWQESRLQLDTLITTLSSTIPRSRSRFWLLAFNNTATTIAAAVDGPSLHGLVKNLVFSGGTNYSSALESAAQFVLSEPTQERSKWLVFITDGLDTVDVERTRSLFAGQLPRVVCVTLRNETPQSLRQLALDSDGGWFELISAAADIVQTGRTIGDLISGRATICTISYQTLSTCQNLHRVQLQYPLHAYGMRYYTRAVSSLDVSTSHVYFGVPLVGATRQAEIVVTARGGPIRIDTVLLRGSSDFSVSGLSNVVLQADQRSTITLQYRARDTAAAWCELIIRTSCNEVVVTASAGRRLSQVTPSHFRIINPRAGDRYFVGNDIHIQWAGIPPDDSCALSISDDEGRSWIPIAENISGYTYHWKIQLQAASRQVLLRLMRRDSYGRIIEIATTDGPIWLDQPDGVIRAVDVGRATVNVRKDTVLHGFIRNTSLSQSLTIEDITFEGQHASDFGLAQCTLPITVPPQDSSTIELYFRPRQLGIRTAEILMRTSGGYVRQVIFGHGTIPPHQHYIVDFGAVPIGSIVDQELPVWTSGVSDLSREGDYTFFQTRLLGSHLISVSFRPDSTRLYSARFVIGDSLSRATISLQGQGIMPTSSPLLEDPTSLRIVALPTAKSVSGGTISIGSYNGIGLLAAYSPSSSLTVFSGGLIPITIGHRRTYALGGGGHGVFSIDSNWTISAGLALAYSFEQLHTTSTSITLATPFALVTTCAGTTRISGGIGYVFKEHRSLQQRFRSDIPVAAIGGDWHFAEHWKLAAETFFIPSLKIYPLVTTVRFFGERFSIDGGIILGIPIEHSRMIAFPLLSAYWVFR